MSATKQRIAQHARTVKEAGLRGEDMSTVLRKIAEHDDLTGQEIRRIAEEANRHVQLDLYKVAGDKRFKFALADGPGIAKEAETRANANPHRKVAALEQAIATSDGDPFAAPVRHNLNDIDLLSTKVSSHQERELMDAEDRSRIAELDKARLEVSDLLKTAQADEVSTASRIHKSHDKAVQSAMDMVSSGITLPSLYDAIFAGISGSSTGLSPEEATTMVDDIAELIIEGLKARGMKNYQLGFRHKGRPDLLEKLTTKDLLALCHQASAYADKSRDLSICDVKTAEYFEGYVRSQNTEGSDAAPLRPVAAEAILKTRASQNGIYAVPQAYLGDVAENLPKGQVRAVNGDHEFVIAVHDLAGDQRRIVKSRAAQEYLGIKLKQIEDAISALGDVRASMKEWHTKNQAKEDAAKKLDPAFKTAGPAGVATGNVEKQAVWGLVAKGLSSFNATGAGKLLNKAGDASVMLPTMGVSMLASSREQKAINEGTGQK